MVKLDLDTFIVFKPLLCCTGVSYDEETVFQN